MYFRVLEKIGLRAREGLARQLSLKVEEHAGCLQHSLSPSTHAPCQPRGSLCRDHKDQGSTLRALDADRTCERLMPS